MDTFAGGLVINSHLHRGDGTRGAGGTVPAQFISQASPWDLEQRFREHGPYPMAAYDERVLQGPWAAHSHAWIASAATALAHCIVSATAFLDLDAVMIEGAATADLQQPWSNAFATPCGATTGRACTRPRGWSWAGSARTPERWAGHCCHCTRVLRRTPTSSSRPDGPTLFAINTIAMSACVSSARQRFCSK